MHSFTSAVRIAPDALNDHIALAQDCVVALNSAARDAASNSAAPDGELRSVRRARGLDAASTARARAQDVVVSALTSSLSPASAREAIKVSLSDCLACSGCVTSAESVLLEEQSIDECVAACASIANDANSAVVVSISAQSRASLCLAYDMEDDDVAAALSGAFKAALGASKCYDARDARDVSLVEMYAEFCERMRDGRAPMLASACPGWVCYAEKVHGALAIPYMSETKSPQQIMGTFVKTACARELGVMGRNVYHVSVMPCYDKKLEASREDFKRDGAKEVDVVLTTGEVSALIERLGFSHLRECPRGKIDRWVTIDRCAPESAHAAPAVSSSGAYAEYVFRRFAAEAHGVDVGEIEWVTLRNADMREATLVVNGVVVLRVAVAYGFRNIQNLVRSLKMKKSPYAFVEVMACPSGCLNGGGQMPAREGMTNKELIDSLDEKYRNVAHARAVADVGALYRDWIGGEPGSDAAKDALRTKFHVRERTVGLVQINNW